MNAWQGLVAAGILAIFLSGCQTGNTTAGGGDNGDMNANGSTPSDNMNANDNGTQPSDDVNGNDDSSPDDMNGNDNAPPNDANGNDNSPPDNMNGNDNAPPPDDMNGNDNAPQPPQTRTLTEIVEGCCLGQVVIVEGQATVKIDDHTYRFVDDKAEFVIVWTGVREIPLNTPLRVSGTVEPDEIRISTFGDMPIPR